MTEWVKSVAGRYFGSSEEASGSTKQQHPSKDITEGALHELLEYNDIRTNDFDKLFRCLTDLGVETFKDLKELEKDDLKEENSEKKNAILCPISGLKPVQARKFFKCIKGIDRSQIREYGDTEDDALTITTRSSAFLSVTDEYTHTPRFISSWDNPKTKERVIGNMSLATDTIQNFIDLIKGQESISPSNALELFTHEGYPMDVNEFNRNCTLLKWKVQDSALFYVFQRPKVQMGLSSILDTTIEPLEHSEGSNNLLIHSLLYDEFMISFDKETDTGNIIKRKIYSLKKIHPSCFELYTRSSDYEPERVDSWNNEELKMLSPTVDGRIIELVMLTTSTSLCKSGCEYSFGKCTYSSIMTQSDKGLSKFYSILYTMIHSMPSTKKEKIVLFMDKEYNLPPLTYALKLIFQDFSLRQFPCWVALFESCYQLFKAILKIYFHVPDNRVFECSDGLWGMISREADKMSLMEIKWKEISLECPLTGSTMLIPVSPPRCAIVYEKYNILQRIDANTAVHGCDVRNLTKDKLLPANDIERLLMLAGFQNSTTFLTWEKNGNTKVIRPIELPADVDVDCLCNCQDVFQPNTELPVRDPGYIVYGRKDMWGIYIKPIKDGSAWREIYDPLYTPSSEATGNVHIQMVGLRAYLRRSKEIDMRSYFTPKVAAVHRCITRSISSATVAENITVEPSEAIVVVLDISDSMNINVYKEDKEKFSRLMAAKQFFHAFLNRSEAYYSKHAVGLISCSHKVEVVVPLTDNFENLKLKIDELNANGRTALNDAMNTGVHLLQKLAEKYPKCSKRLLCLTDGEDNASKCNRNTVHQQLRRHGIVLDSVLICGSKGNLDQKALSHGSGGFCFCPDTLEDALKVFEMETMLLAKERKQKGHTKEDMLENFKDLDKYPFEPSNPYGNEALSTNFSTEFDKAQFTTPKRIVQHTVLLGMGESLKTTDARVQRILKEIRHYLKDPHPDIDIYPQEVDISKWKIVMAGPRNTPYEEGTFLLYAKFPVEYPIKPPEIRFSTPIYHCNINSAGRICHSSLDTRYFPTESMKKILTYIYGLLMAPEPADPLDSLAGVWEREKTVESQKSKALLFCRQFATYALSTIVYFFKGVLALELTTNRVMYDQRARQIVTEFATKLDRAAYKRQTLTEDTEAPDGFVCPLTKKLYVDPVITDHGHTYERSALEEYLKDHNNMDPVAQKPIKMAEVRKNLVVKKMVDNYKKRQLI